MRVRIKNIVGHDARRVEFQLIVDARGLEEAQAGQSGRQHTLGDAVEVEHLALVEKDSSRCSERTSWRAAPTPTRRCFVCPKVGATKRVPAHGDDVVVNVVEARHSPSQCSWTTTTTGAHSGDDVVIRT
jgi:hypothetical protein